MHQSNFPYSSVYEYLSQHNLLEAPPEQISKAKADYWKLYQKHYQANYRKRRKPINLLINPDDFLELQDHAEILNLSVRELVEIAVDQYIRKNSKVAGIGRKIFQSLRSIQGEIVNFLRDSRHQSQAKHGHLKTLADRVSELENIIRHHFE